MSNQNSTFEPIAQVEAATTLLRRYEAALNPAEVDVIVGL